MNNLGHSNSVDNSFYYFVLNLNRGASQAEINERHRALSLIFHPDKQRDDESRKVATQKFLEIQKAYQVLSDPFLRQVYDALGERGLSVHWESGIRSKSPDDVQQILLRTRQELAYKDFESKVSPSTVVTCGIDATSLLDASSHGTGLAQTVYQSVRKVQVISLGAKHTVKKKFDDKTTVGLKTRFDRLARGSEASFLGTLRHQFSPRFTAEADIGFLWPHFCRIKGIYSQNGNTLTVSTSSMLGMLGERPPSLDISVSRRLFRKRLETASLELTVGRRPHFGLSMLFPSIFDTRPLGQTGEPTHLVAPSTSGLDVGTTHRKLGLMFDSVLPTLVAEWGVHFVELALQLKVGVQYGLSGLSCICGGTWSNSSTTVTIASVFDPTGVSLKVDLDYLQQEFSFPVVLSVEPRIDLALWMVVLPSTALVVGYHFIIKPRRLLKRLEHIRAARKALDEDFSHRNDRHAVISLLKDSARKMQVVEMSKGGLIITEATYGAHATEDGAPDLLIDVTIPLQGLVRNSQLYISADHPKSMIQGFTDPAPSVLKVLSIRYTFAGHAHYAEIPDDMPVVLPLADHHVE